MAHSHFTEAAIGTVQRELKRCRSLLLHPISNEPGHTHRLTETPNQIFRHFPFRCRNPIEHILKLKL